MSLVKSDNNGNGRHIGRVQKSLLYDCAIVFSGHDGAVLTSKFSPNGQNIASGGMDRTILLWHLPTNPDDDSPNYGQLQGHKGAVTSLTWALESSIFTTSADSTVAFWDAETGQRIRKGQGHEMAINDSCNSGELSLSVGDDGTARLWDSREKKEVTKISTPYPVLCCDSTDDTVFLSGIDPTIQAYDLRTNSILWKCEGNTESVTSLALSSDKSMLVSRAMDGLVRTLSAKNSVPAGIPRMGNNTYEGTVGSSAEQLLVRAKFSSDDIYIALGSEDRTSVLWSTATRRMMQKFSGHEGTVIDVDFHPSERIMLYSSTDKTLIVREY